MVSINPNFGTNGAGGVNKAPRAGKTLDQYIPQPGKTDIEPSVIISINAEGKKYIEIKNDGIDKAYVRVQDKFGGWSDLRELEPGETV